MKKAIKRICICIAVLAVGLWVLDKVPFRKTIDRQITAVVYENGQAVGETAISLSGERTSFLLTQADHFFGTFHISCLEGTLRDGRNAEITWNRDVQSQSVQLITYMDPGVLLSAPKLGLVPYLLTDEDLTQLALMLTDGRVIATSDELQALYTAHISYDADVGVATITGVIPAL